MRNPLTDRQELVLDFIKDFMLENKYPPTTREVAEGMNITIKGARDHLKSIERKGYITIEIEKSRAIIINDDVCYYCNKTIW